MLVLIRLLWLYAAIVALAAGNCTCQMYLVLIHNVLMLPTSRHQTHAEVYKVRKCGTVACMYLVLVSY